jgi:hypothetical protein
MKGTGLEKLYDRLTVWERIPASVAAAARDDEAEYRRLFNTSRLWPWLVPEHLPSELALHILALIYVGEQLDAAATYFFVLWKMRDRGEPRPGDWRTGAEACAYFFAANADAWRRFEADLNILPGTLAAGNHQGWFLRFCEEQMPANAPTADALRALLEAGGQEVPQLVTADDLLADWRNLLQSMTHNAPREGTKRERGTPTASPSATGL